MILAPERRHAGRVVFLQLGLVPTDDGEPLAVWVEQHGVRAVFADRRVAFKRSQEFYGVEVVVFLRSGHAVQARTGAVDHDVK